MTATPDDRSGNGGTRGTGRLPPGPDGLPVLGNTLSLARDPIGFFDRMAAYGDVVRYELAGQPFTMVLHPTYVERLLVTDSDSLRKFRFEEFGFGSGNDAFAPEGVLFSEGEQWRAQRTALQAAFTPDRIERYGETMVATAAEHAAGWPRDEGVAIDRRFSELTLDILARTLFDLDLDGRGEAITDVARALNERADTRNLSAFLPSWVPTPSQRRYDRAMGAFDELVDELIAGRRGDEDLDRRDDLLSLLLARAGPEGYRHSQTELRDQLLTFLFAGHETTSLALTYTTLLLSRHPTVHDRLHAEWDEVLGGDDPTPADLSALAYTDRVVRESLRLYPPAFAVFRTVLEDLTLDGYLLPVGTNVTIPQFRIHRDPRLYDDPERFRPDRWTDGFEEGETWSTAGGASGEGTDSRAGRPEYAYFPFGGGPRHCIGMRFAMTELTLVLPTILRRVEVDPLSDPEPDLAPGATLQPADDVRVRIQERGG